MEPLLIKKILSRTKVNYLTTISSSIWFIKFTIAVLGFHIISEYFIDKRVAVMSEKDRKIGHRRINEEGEVSYKKIQSNQIVASIQLGIQVNGFKKYSYLDTKFKGSIT